MRPGLRAFLGAALTCILLFTAALVMADDTTVNLQVRNLVSFNDPTKAGNWIVQASKFATQSFPEFKMVKSWPEAVYGRNKDNKELYSMGIHSKFDRKGYNYIEIIPAAKDASGNLAPTTIPIPGKVQRLDIWVWGSNYNYTMDVFLRDFRGIDHVLHLGSLQYIGWRDLAASIPGAIPQSRRYIPQFQGLELTKMVIWTGPDEKVDDYWVFLNDMTILTDLYNQRFDGEDLADPDYLNQIWQASK